MSTHKHIDQICCAVLAFVLVLTVMCMCAQSLGIEISARELGYENRLFSTDRVHTIDIVIDDWDEFIATAQSEEYSVCSVVIDGEVVKNVGIRGKGNTSLSSVSSMGSQRYSFKIEFDQYDNTKSYHGLDKLSLNNVIQDNTYMKDYLVYRMMNAFGVSAPLCSYAYITVNGEDWGLYLAVEGVEDSFLQRNYGSDYGELYKPDSMSLGGGRGNGMKFDMSDFTTSGGGMDMSDFFGSGEGTMPSFGSGDGSMPSFGSGDGSMPSFGSGEGSIPSFGGNGGSMPSFGGSSGAPAEDGSSSRPSRDDTGKSGFEMPDMGSMGGIGGFGGMGSSDVKLQYIDDNASSYSNIFNNAKTDITEADQKRLISSLKQLSTYTDIEEVVDVEQVLRYFVVHNFVVNGDSYTGSMIHNYYLYEEDGTLAMIPWDYNLAFGTFMGGNASSSVNESIDEVLSDRPMQAWIFSDEKYSSQYYALYAQLIEQVDIQGIIDQAYSLIAPYVAKDPTAFCTYEKFEKGVATIKSFCALRSESVKLQLEGSELTVDASGLNISDMGTMGGSMGGFGGGEMPSRQERPKDGKTESDASTVPTAYVNTAEDTQTDENDSSQQMPWGGGIPDMGDFDMSNLPQGGMQFPGNTQGGQRPTTPGGSIGSANMGPSVSEEAILTGVSFAVLLAGLVFAALFKRRR